jgi:hypothetical protein
VIGSLSLESSSGSTLWSQSNTPITQSGPLILAFDTPWLSEGGGWLSFVMDVRNLPTGNANRESIGIDLVQFGQVSQAVSTTVFTQADVAGVPEPGTWALMLLGAGGIALRRRRGSN